MPLPVDRFIITKEREWIHAYLQSELSWAASQIGIN